MMKRDDYVNEYGNELEKMYEEYYTGEDGHCRYFAECRKSNEKSFTLTSDKARVGKCYGDGGVPKIVFVGLEGKNEHRSVGEPDHSAPNPHYSGVRYILAYLLSGIFDKNKPCGAQPAALDKYSQTIDYFALLNCFKCVFLTSGQSSNISHTNAMKKNCQKILFREIEILQPDILVIQVKKHRPADLEENINVRFGGGSRGELLDGDSTTGAYKYKPFILIWTYHGAGGPNNTRNWPNNPDYIKSLNHTLDIVIEEFKKTRQK